MLPHEFWQEFEAPPLNGGVTIHENSFPAQLADGRILRLPIRVLADGNHALASLILNQAGFAVVDALADDLARQLAPYMPDVIVGLPTLGLTLASAVAQKLGHSRYVPLGTSVKFWYDDALSAPLASITTPGQSKRLYIDPRMLPLLDDKRVVLIDDVISSGTSIIAGLSVLAKCQIEPVALGFAMLQSDRWRQTLEVHGPHWPDRVVGVMRSPMLERSEGGWKASEGPDGG
jgi:adenine/guanine phosphoribosyltransferase-like PRPP-binding protein